MDYSSITFPICHLGSVLPVASGLLSLANALCIRLQSYFVFPACPQPQFMLTWPHYWTIHCHSQSKIAGEQYPKCIQSYRRLSLGSSGVAQKNLNQYQLLDVYSDMAFKLLGESHCYPQIPFYIVHLTRPGSESDNCMDSRLMNEMLT